MTIPLASDQEGSEGTSRGARNRPKQGWVRILKLIVCIPPEQYFLNMFDNFIEKRVSTSRKGKKVGAQGNLLLPSMVLKDPVSAPNLQTPLSKTAALPLPISPFHKAI